MPGKAIIGLEVHVQLKTKSKLFCGCNNKSDDDPPNTNVCPVCMGHPGTLPVLNRQALEYAILAAHALNCRIPEKAKFDRKNYFYPDLPKGYQISQFDKPICVNGKVSLRIPTARTAERKNASIRITRIHMEEDAAKNIHENDKTYVDFNRAGTPLIEIVTEPDFRTPAEAKIFLQELRRIMRYLEISDADMEKGHMRCDANVSLLQMPPGQASAPDENDPTPPIENLNPKTELKNINSFRAVERALAYEIQRQTKLWNSGKPPSYNSTRGWNESKGITFEQRGKEGSADYRYFPEPDLPPLLLGGLAREMKPRMPELPAEKRARFREEYGFSPGDALILTEEKHTARYTEEVMMELREWIHDTDQDGTENEKWERNRKKLIKLFSGWFISKLFGLMDKHHVHIKTLKITPENFAELLTLIHQNRVGSAAALQILEKMMLTGGDPSQIMEESQLEQVTDEAEIAEAVREAIENNPHPVDDFKAGKQNALQFLVGQVMKSTRGRANPDLAQKLLQKMLK